MCWLPAAIALTPDNPSTCTGVVAAEVVRRAFGRPRHRANPELSRDVAAPGHHGAVFQQRDAVFATSDGANTGEVTYGHGRFALFPFLRAVAELPQSVFPPALTVPLLSSARPVLR